MTWFRILQLVLGIYRADLHEVPPLVTLYEIVHTAVWTDTYPYDPSLLLTMAAYESHWDARATSWVDRHGVRHTGIWNSTEPPPFDLRRGGLYCGLTQATATSWSDCLELRKLDVIFKRTTSELVSNLSEPGVKTLPQAVAAYRAGNNFRQPGIIAKVRFLYRKAAKIRGYP